MSCSTNATRSAGASVSSTTSKATPTESASSNSRSGPRWVSAPATNSETWRSAVSSRRALRVRNMSRQTRATTVVSQPPRLSTAPLSDRLSRSQAS